MKHKSKVDTQLKGQGIMQFIMSRVWLRHIQRKEWDMQRKKENFSWRDERSVTIGRPWRQWLKEVEAVWEGTGEVSWKREVSVGGEVVDTMHGYSAEECNGSNCAQIGNMLVSRKWKWRKRGLG